MGCWSTGCWRRACGCWRCTPTRSRPRATGSARRAGSLIGSTDSCCASWRALTVTVSGFLEPDSGQTKALRALVRAREDLVGARVALANQLRAELGRFWPGPIGLFSAIDSPISLAFLARYPSPADTRMLGEKRMAGFLKAQHYSSRKTAAELLEAAALSAGRARRGDRDTRPTFDRGALRYHAADDGRSDHRAGVGDRPSARCPSRWGIFRSFFRSRESVICAATLLAEIGDSRGRYPHRDAIAADGGQVPVAKESGKRKHAQFRWACNKRLRNALSTLAHSTRMWNPWAADRYAAARARGHNHRRALRTLGRAWCRIIWRCWTHHTPYDPARHTGLQQHLLVTVPGQSGARPDLTATQRMAGETVTRRTTRRAERASA